MGSVHNPQDVAIGAVQLSGVLEIRWRQRRREIISPPGDGLTHHSGVEYGAVTADGRLIFADPIQASSASGLFGTLTATLKGVGGGADRTLTITGVRTGESDNTVAHNRAAECAVRFLASGDDGISSPVTLA